jgi:hypothetical protein
VHSTTYTLLVTVDSGAEASDEVTISVVPALSVDAGETQTVAAGALFTLSAEAAGGTPPYQFVWSPPLAVASSADGESMQASVSATTVFVVAVADAAGRTASDFVTISVPPPLTVDAGADTSIAVGGSAVLTATVSGGLAPYTIAWSPAVLSLTADQQSVRAAPGENAEYTVTVSDAFGTLASDTVRVNLATPLQVSVVGDPISIEAGNGSLLQAAVSGGVPPYEFAWSPAETLSAADGNQVWATPESATTYTVAVADAVGQTASAEVRIDVRLVAGSQTFAPVLPSLCGFGIVPAVPLLLATWIPLRRRFVTRR